MNNALTSCRKLRNFTRKNIASKLHVTVTYYENLEKGTVRVSLKTAKRLSKIFCVPKDIFMYSYQTVPSSVVFLKCHFENGYGYVNHVEQNQPQNQEINLIKLLKANIKALRHQNQKLVKVLKQSGSFY